MSWFGFSLSWTLLCHKHYLYTDPTALSTRITLKSTITFSCHFLHGLLVWKGYFQKQAPPHAVLGTLNVWMAMRESCRHRIRLGAQPNVFGVTFITSNAELCKLGFTELLNLVVIRYMCRILALEAFSLLTTVCMESRPRHQDRREENPLNITTLKDSDETWKSFSKCRTQSTGTKTGFQNIKLKTLLQQIWGGGSCDLMISLLK